MDRRTYTPEQLSEYLQIPVETLAYWRRQGSGPRWYMAGRHPRYRDADVTMWEEAQVAKQAESA